MKTCACKIRQLVDLVASWLKHEIQVVSRFSQQAVLCTAVVQPNGEIGGIQLSGKMGSGSEVFVFCFSIAYLIISGLLTNTLETTAHCCSGVDNCSAKHSRL